MDVENFKLNHEKCFGCDCTELGRKNRKIIRRMCRRDQKDTRPGHPGTRVACCHLCKDVGVGPPTT